MVVLYGSFGATFWAAAARAREAHLAGKLFPLSPLLVPRLFCPKPRRYVVFGAKLLPLLSWLVVRRHLCQDRIQEL